MGYSSSIGIWRILIKSIDFAEDSEQNITSVIMDIKEVLLLSLLKYFIPLIVVFVVALILTKEYIKGGKTQINPQLLVFCLIISMAALVFVTAITHLANSLYYSVKFFTNDIADVFVNWRQFPLFLHIFFALGCTFLGPLLFLKPFRDKHPKYHRKIGKIYVFGALLSAVIVLPLAITNGGGIYPRIGFTVMAITWFSITYMAYCYARVKNFPEHRRWALRSYAMTFAFVHVNFTFKMLGVYSILEAYPVLVKVMQSMVSWMSNLVIIEIYLAATTFKGKFVGKQMWFDNLFNKNRFQIKRHWNAISSKAKLP